MRVLQLGQASWDVGGASGGGSVEISSHDADLADLGIFGGDGVFVLGNGGAGTLVISVDGSVSASVSVEEGTPEERFAPLQQQAAHKGLRLTRRRGDRADGSITVEVSREKKGAAAGGSERPADWREAAGHEVFGALNAEFGELREGVRQAMEEMGQQASAQLQVKVQSKRLERILKAWRRFGNVAHSLLEMKTLARVQRRTDEDYNGAGS